MKYFWAMLVGAALGMSGCQWQRTADERAVYQIQGINAYRGQSVADLFEVNGAPNAVRNIDDNTVMWIYYTNYRPVGGGEIISYDQPTKSQKGTACLAKIVIQNETVQEVMSNCR